MQWGLEGIQLSYDHPAVNFGSGIIGSIQNTMTQDKKANYDYYITKHDSAASGTMHDREGFDFCAEIIQVVNGYGNHDMDASNNIDILHLGQDPRSAIEYCYNKNKRDANGHVASTDNTDYLKWYLPAVDQIEDIVMSSYGGGQATYARFLDFQAKPYWSSQPSYIRNYYYYYGTLTGLFDGAAYGDYYIDDVNHARSTTVEYIGGTNPYNYEPSGVVAGTHHQVWYHRERIFGTDEDRMISEGTFTDSGENIKLGPVQREAGNIPRTSYARVRCVRKP